MFAGEYDEAKSYFQRIVELDPLNGPSHALWAYAEHRLRNYTKAREICSLALSLPRLSPENRIQLYYILSEACVLSGDLEKGVGYGYHAKSMSLHGVDSGWEDNGVSIGPDHFEVLSEAYNDLAELAINVNTDFEKATALYKAREELRKRYVGWLGEVAPRSLFLPEDWVRNIGHIALLDFWVKMQKLGWGPWDRLVLLAPPQQTANHVYLKYFKQFYKVVSSDLASAGMRHLCTTLGRRLSCLLHLPDSTTPYLPEGIGLVQQEWERQGREPLLRLTSEDAAFGSAQLRKMGVPEGVWFACVHVRSAGFHREGTIMHQAHRNAEIETYLPALHAIVDRGGWVIRLGDPSMEPLPKLKGVVDYARGRFKSARMDVILSAAARFFIGVTSGLSHVPTTFGVPCLLTNWVSNSLPVYGRHDLFIPKLVRHRLTRRLLSFDEWLSRRVRDYSYSGEGLARNELEVIDNTADELQEAVIEMMDGLDGKETQTLQSRALQEAFDELARRHGVRGYSRIGTGFLRRHADLLDPGFPVSSSPAKAA